MDDPVTDFIIGAAIFACIVATMIVARRLRYAGLADRLKVPAPPVEAEDPVPAGKLPYCGLCGARMKLGEDINGSRFDRKSGQKAIDYWETWCCPRWRNQYPEYDHDHEVLGNLKTRWA